MIREYHRPKSLDEAMKLIARKEPLSLPLGGGTKLNQPSSQKIDAVDLQDLGLNTLETSGNYLDMGATLTLQGLLERGDPTTSGEIILPPAFIKAIKHEATYNLRQAATVAGTLVAAGGRSPFTAAALALDAKLTLLPGSEVISLGDLLPLRDELLLGRLITQVTIPLNVKLEYEYVSRSPADWAIVSAAAAVWPSGRTRVVLGGYGVAPVLAFDGAEAGGVRDAAESAYSQAGDEWASAEYRKEIAGVLAARCLEQIAE